MRAVAASGAVVLLLVQLLASWVSGAERGLPFGSEAGIATLSAPVCRAAPDGGHIPGQTDDIRHCAACLLGCDAPSAAGAVSAAVLAPPAPLAGAIVAPAHRRVFAAAAGWRSSWSSRAPPIG